jgi:hypothetical protein
MTVKQQSIKELSLALAERDKKIADLENRVKDLEACVIVSVSLGEERKDRIAALEEVLRLKDLELKQFTDYSLGA